MKWKVLLVLVFAVSMVLAACGSSSTSLVQTEQSGNSQKEASASTEKKLRIAYVPGMTIDPFYISMKFGAEEMAKKLGVELIWTGSPEWDYAKQSPIVDSLVAEKVDAIIITPTDEKAMVAPLKRAKQAGIPVFTVDTNVSDDSVYVANVTADNVQGGMLGADTLAKLIGESGKVLVIGTKPGITTGDEREKGFKEQIKKYPNIQIIATEYTDDQIAVSAKKTADVLLAHPDLAGIFVGSGLSGTGVAQTLRVQNLQNKVKLISYDAGPDQVKALKAGEMQALISQKPLEEARSVMQMAVDYIQGKKDMKKLTVLDNVSVTVENVDKPEVQQWLYRSE
ncbi:ABC transporter substrate-binding protein [Brevibacillus choshinensis]|uniref:ABC transporter substrate-binding protein n=1 Tax=Brevibacillus choshinensis TaxID=54911 RepID=UPI002E201D05|nr:ABC transporter substrate-binding protein [Brevibacillus choshinensis]MED4750386.1 ABC transporter substrate-binding protein [Brevibacillus choshinensis]